MGLLIGLQIIRPCQWFWGTDTQLNMFNYRGSDEINIIL